MVFTYVFRNETDYQGMLEFIRSGQPFDAVRIEAYRRDGTTRWISVCGRPLKGVAGAVYEITTSLIPTMTAVDEIPATVASTYRPNDGKEESP